MTTTADWLHLKLGLPLGDHADDNAGSESGADSESNLVARQRAYAAAPLSVVFPGR